MFFEEKGNGYSSNCQRCVQMIDDAKEFPASKRCKHVSQGNFVFFFGFIHVGLGSNVVELAQREKDKGWYDLGCRFGEVDNRVTRLMNILQSRYGKSNAYFKLLSNFLTTHLVCLEGELDSIISADYPRNIHYLPNYKDVPITNVFYNLNRYTPEEANSFIVHIKPLPKNLTDAQIDDGKQSVQYVSTFLDDVDEEFFYKQNKHICSMRKALAKLSKLWS